jgi:hypothetical protein
MTLSIEAPICFYPPAESILASADVSASKDGVSCEYEVCAAAIFAKLRTDT